MDAHGQHVGDGVALVAHRQRLRVVALTVTNVALDPHVRQEVHLDLLLAVALAGFASAARLVEAEALRTITTYLGLGQLREQLTNQVKHAGIRGRIRGRRVADGVLIDVDDLVDVLQTEDVIVSGRGGAARCSRRASVRYEDLVDQRTLAGAADAGDGDERAQRKRHVDVLQIVLPRPLDGEPANGRRQPAGGGHTSRLTPAVRLRHSAIRRDRNGFLAGEILAGERCLAAEHLFEGAARGDVAAAVAAAGTEIEQIIGRRDHLAVVFYQDERVTQVAEVLQAPSSRRLSRGCRPMVGSSRTYRTPVSPLPI